MGKLGSVSTDTPADSPLIAGRYRLGRILGAGGAAVVHEGCDLDTGERVAVKLYRADGSGHPTQHHRELKALTSLRHPGLVALLDGGTEPGPDGRTYVVTDLVEGPSLARRLDAGPLNADEVRVLAIGLGEALAHVHAHGFVHRDVKPANILLEHGHEPRLADFGIARALDGTVYTATGAVAGTAAYLAPEQVRGETVDPSVDVFALGLVLIEALTGEREYPGTLAESAAARLHRRPVVPAGLPSDLAAVLAAMTDPDPALRPSAAAVATGLRTRAVARPARARRRAWGWGARTALAAAVLLVALLGGAVLLFGRTAASAPLVPVPNIAAPEAVAAPSEPSPSGPGQVVAAPVEPVELPVVARAAVAVPAADIAAPAAAPAAADRPRADRPRAPAPAPAAAPAAAPAPAAPAAGTDAGASPPAADEPAQKATGKDKNKGNGNGNNGNGNGGGNGKGNNGNGNGNGGGNGNSGKGQGSQGEE
jgi:eukaryotic-like serine/threonine-protein kinase